MNITDNEWKMIVNIAENDYAGGDPSAEVWSDCLEDGPNYINPTSIPGLISSLAKKGLVHPGDIHCAPRDRAVQLTEEGVRFYHNHEQ